MADIAIKSYLTDGEGRASAQGKATEQTIEGSPYADYIIGTDNNDLIYGWHGSDDIEGGLGHDVIYGENGNDWIWGDHGHDSLYGNTGHDRLWGGPGLDNLYGGSGNDILNGGAHGDYLNGGYGADIFRFTQTDVFRQGRFADFIEDFFPAEGDLIDVSRIDAIRGGGDDAFRFIGDNAFTGRAGQLRYEIDGDSTYVEIDTDGDAVYDYYIELNGQIDLVSSDFIL